MSPKAIRFARAIALVSQTLPIPAAMATGALVAACEEPTEKPPEHPVGIVQPPDRPRPPDPPIQETPNTPDAGAKPVDTAQPVEHPVGTMTAPTAKPEVEVGKRAAPEKPPGKPAAPEKP